MTKHQMAQSLGQRGGRARARRLGARERAQIASLGGKARSLSLRVARRIVENLEYAAVVQALEGPAARVRRLSTCRRRLPGIYRERT
jgi:hypothetical protein